MGNCSLIGFSIILEKNFKMSRILLFLSLILLAATSQILPIRPLLPKYISQKARTSLSIETAKLHSHRQLQQLPLSPRQQILLMNRFDAVLYFQLK